MNEQGYEIADYVKVPVNTDTGWVLGTVVGFDEDRHGNECKKRVEVMSVRGAPFGRSEKPCMVDMFPATQLELLQDRDRQSVQGPIPAHDERSVWDIGAEMGAICCELRDGEAFHDMDGDAKEVMTRELRRLTLRFLDLFV